MKYDMSTSKNELIIDIEIPDKHKEKLLENSAIANKENVLARLKSIRN